MLFYWKRDLLHKSAQFKNKIEFILKEKIGKKSEIWFLEISSQGQLNSRGNSTEVDWK